MLSIGITWPRDPQPTARYGWVFILADDQNTDDDDNQNRSISEPTPLIIVCCCFCSLCSCISWNFYLLTNSLRINICNVQEGLFLEEKLKVLLLANSDKQITLHSNIVIYISLLWLYTDCCCGNCNFVVYFQWLVFEVWSWKFTIL